MATTGVASRCGQRPSGLAGAFLRELPRFRTGPTDPTRGRQHAEPTDLSACGGRRVRRGVGLEPGGVCQRSQDETGRASAHNGRAGREISLVGFHGEPGRSGGVPHGVNGGDREIAETAGRRGLRLDDGGNHRCRDARSDLELLQSWHRRKRPVRSQQVSARTGGSVVGRVRRLHPDQSPGLPSVADPCRLARRCVPILPSDTSMERALLAADASRILSFGQTAETPHHEADDPDCRPAFLP